MLSKKEREENEVFAKKLLSHILELLGKYQGITVDDLSYLKLDLRVTIGMERERDNTVSVKLGYAFIYPIYGTKDFLESNEFTFLMATIIQIVQNKTKYKKVYEYAE